MSIDKSALVLLSLLLSACGGRDLQEDAKVKPAEPKDELTAERVAAGGLVTLVVGPEGGVLVFSEGRLVVPAGALDTRLELTAEPLLEGVRLGPSGLRFDDPVTLVLSSPVAAPITKLHVGVEVEGMDLPVTFREPLPTSFEAGELATQIRGFSTYVRGAAGEHGGLTETVGSPLGRLESAWDPCQRQLELQWTGARPVMVERVELRGSPRQRHVSRFLMAGAGATPSLRRESPDRSGEDEPAPIVRFEAYSTGSPEWAQVRYATEAQVVVTEVDPKTCSGSPIAPRDEGCGQVTAPRITISSEGRSFPQDEVFVDISSEDHTSFQLAAEGVTVAPADFVWEESVRGDFVELGRGSMLDDAGLGCPVGGGYCQLRVTVSDTCGQRRAGVYYQIND